jgi:hypothetical protein
MREAIGTSLVVIAASSASALLGHLGHVAIDWPLAAAVTGAAVTGSLVGTRFAHRVAQHRLRRGFAWFVAAMALFVIGRQAPVVFSGGIDPMYWMALLGGVIIGVASAALLLLSGRVAGVSGIAGGIVARARDLAWRLSFVGGLVAGGVLMSVLRPGSLAWTVERSWPALAVAGVLVGVGTALANGCTSGHGVCGVSRLAPRSIVATVTFMVTGMVAVFAVKQLFGGVL